MNISREDGFTLAEMLVSTVVMLLVVGGALTTFKNAVAVNDTASQLADANQNLRAGTNQLVKDVLMAGRVIGTDGIAMPTGVGITYKRPGPVNVNFNLDAGANPTLQLPSISTGYQLGPAINGTLTDIITIMTVDEFMPTVTTPPLVAGTPTATEGTIAPDGTSVTLPPNSLWLLGDAVNDTPKIQVGDLVLYKGQNGNAIQTVTSTDATHIYFAVNDSNDFFHFNQLNATSDVNHPLYAVKQVGQNLCPWGQVCPPTATVAMTTPSQWAAPVTLFKALMITYYVDSTTTPGTPRLTRLVNNFTPQALAGVVEQLSLTYDLYDGVTNPTGVPSLPYTLNNVTYTESMIRKVNVNVGVRSETLSKPMQDYVRNRITTSVNVRSLAAVDRYVSQ